MSCRAVPCRAVSCHIVPCRVVPCRAVWCHIVPCRAVPCRAVSYRVVSCRVVLCRAISCRAVSCRAVLCRVLPCRVVSCCILSCRAVPCRAVRCLSLLEDDRLVLALADEAEDWCQVNGLRLDCVELEDAGEEHEQFHLGEDLAQTRSGAWRRWREGGNHRGGVISNQRFSFMINS